MSISRKTWQDDAELYRTELVEKICELDDDLMMQYLEGEEPSVEDLKKVTEKSYLRMPGYPGMLRFRLQKQGRSETSGCCYRVYACLRSISRAIKGVDMDGNEIVRHSSDEEPFSALVFKIMTDPFVGKLAYFRVYSGTINSGSYVLNATKGKKERVGRILQMHANKTTGA